MQQGYRHMQQEYRQKDRRTIKLCGTLRRPHLASGRRAGSGHCWDTQLSLSVYLRQGSREKIGHVFYWQLYWTEWWEVRYWLCGVSLARLCTALLVLVLFALFREHYLRHPEPIVPVHVPTRAVWPCTSHAMIAITPSLHRFDSRVILSYCRRALLPNWALLRSAGLASWPSARATTASRAAARS
jgi:hypothetical protein